MWLQSFQYDLQHDFAWVADEADRLVVLALLQVTFVVRAVIFFLLHLLGLVLLGCCQLQQTFLSSKIVLQCPLLCEGRDGNPLCLSGDSLVLVYLHLLFDCTDESSILSISSVSPVLLEGFFLNGLGQ